MGTPVFYFYPPLFFWVTSLVDTATGGAISAERLVPLASLIILAVSGLSMRAWLAVHSTERRATIGAVAYMLAPFHLYHFYGSGALAEATAYASVPLVALALERLAAGRTRFLSLLALAYAALLFSHLPTALLVSLFLIVPYVALLAAQSARPVPFLATALAGGLIGILIAAIFVVPALTLLPYVSPHALSGSFYRPENWFFWHLRAEIMAARMLLIVPISIAATLLALGAAITVRSKPSRREPLFWAGLTVLLVILIAGGVPPVWKLPGLSLVQFPWRMLVLVEFTTITLLVIVAPPLRNPFTLAGAATLAFAYVALGMVAEHMIGRTWTGQSAAAAAIRSEYQDAPEYLPAGTLIELGQNPDDVHLVLPHLPAASAADADARIGVAQAADGGMTVAVQSPRPTRVKLGRFYFPHWRIRDSSGNEVPVANDPRDRVVSFLAPAGRTTFYLRAGNAPYQLLGGILSLVGCMLLIAIAVMPLRIR